MEVTREIFLALSVLLAFCFVFVLVRWLDKFLSENRKAISTEEEKQEPTAVMLSKEMTPEEMAEEIDRFCNHHKNVRVVLYDESNKDFFDKTED